MEELKKCPFCGAKVAEISNAHDLEECGNFEHEDCPCNLYEDAGDCDYYTVVCSMDKGGCGSSSGYFATKELAFKAWNRRCCDW